jgi:hypothetical protein
VGSRKKVGGKIKQNRNLKNKIEDRKHTKTQATKRGKKTKLEMGKEQRPGK